MQIAIAASFGFASAYWRSAHNVETIEFVANHMPGDLILPVSLILLEGRWLVAALAIVWMTAGLRCIGTLDVLLLVSAAALGRMLAHWSLGDLRPAVINVAGKFATEILLLGLIPVAVFGAIVVVRSIIKCIGGRN